jgi:hypothetical protein
MLGRPRSKKQNPALRVRGSADRPPCIVSTQGRVRAINALRSGVFGGVRPAALWRCDSGSRLGRSVSDSRTMARLAAEGVVMLALLGRRRRDAAEGRR